MSIHGGGAMPASVTLNSVMATPLICPRQVSSITIHELQRCENGPTSNQGVSGFKAVFADFRRVQSQFEIDFQINAKSMPISILNCPNININVFSGVSQHFCFRR